MLINAGKGVTLYGELNTHSDIARPLLVLFHGWEGSSGSNYVVSAMGLAFRMGFNVFRLNFRDHNDTHELNKGIFNSSLIEEVVGAVSDIQQRVKYTTCVVAGFSLGGNFALRVGIHASELAGPPSAIVAICPVINPANATQAVSESLFIYDAYFSRKWKSSLRKKLSTFPEYNYGQQLDQRNSLHELNEFFIPNYTEFDSLSAYFDSYTLTPERLMKISCPTLVIASEDDPVIPVTDVVSLKQKMNEHSTMAFDIQEKGSHCAFLESLFKRSWADERALKFFKDIQKAPKGNI